MSRIHQHRVETLNDQAERSSGSYVLYWMQQSQRAEFKVRSMTRGGLDRKGDPEAYIQAVAQRSSQ